MNAAVQKKPVRTLIMRMLAGAVVGAATMGLFLTFVGDPFADLKDPATMAAIAAGAIYVLMGLSVAFGLAAPRAGATFLNVEDADELREEAGKLGSSAVAALLSGAFLLVLAFADALGSSVALPLAGACLAGAAIAGWVGAKHQDELTRQVGLEAAALALQIVFVAIGGWAALAVLGYAIWMGPLALISSLMLLQLVAIFIVIGKRGMLMPR